jgi:hypothetical protein
MGKMPGTVDERNRRRVWGGAEHILKALELLVGQSVKKRLEEHHGFTEAGVQVVVDGVEQVPALIRAEGFVGCQFVRGRCETGIQFFDEIGESGNLVSELGLTSQEDAAEEIVEKSDTLAAGMPEVLGVERGEIGSDAKVFRMIEHRAQQAIHRKGKSVAESRSNRENLICFASAASAAHAESFVEIHAEHGVRGFEAPNAIDVKVGFVAL